MPNSGIHDPDSCKRFRVLSAVYLTGRRLWSIIENLRVTFTNESS
jgi:hypothetical protein